MYVCNCNGIKDTDIDAAVRAGATKALDVYRHVGARPVCGRCIKEITQRMAKGPRPYHVALDERGIRERHAEMLAQGFTWDGDRTYEAWQPT